MYVDERRSLKVTNGDTWNNYQMTSYQVREKMAADKSRPRFHFLPPQGRWNDINGAVFHNGRYHLGYLQKISNREGELDFSSWQHISSKDLLHWRYQTAYLDEPMPDARGDYFNSGGIISGAPIPTLIVNMPRSGICIYQCHDDSLDKWEPMPQNPVIPTMAGWPRNHEPAESRHRIVEAQKSDLKFPETVIFDPSGWMENGIYYVLIGNKNYRPGYEGDSTSLFKSRDLINWDYVGPFYKSSRKWTAEEEDCADSDFFKFGNNHMLLMHTHRPYPKSQYYIGTLHDEYFEPEMNGQLSHLGAMNSGPETLLDDKGRRIFWGWVRDATRSKNPLWDGVMTLPWHLTPARSHLGLNINPVVELESLRYDEIKLSDFTLSSGTEKEIPEFNSDCAEIKLTISPNSSSAFGLKLLSSLDGQEQTIVSYDMAKQEFVVDFQNSSSDDTIIYNCGPELALKGTTLKQRVPYPAPFDQLNLNIFVDKSIIEIFVNSEICIVQRVYPLGADSKHFFVFTQDKSIKVTNLRKWEMDSTNPW